MSQPQPKSQGRMKPASVVYWLRVVMAVSAGFANHFTGISEASLGEAALPAGIGLGLVIYLLSILIVRNLLRYGETELKGKNKYITLGGGTFIVIWVMVAVLLNTLLG